MTVSCEPIHQAGDIGSPREKSVGDDPHQKTLPVLGEANDPEPQIGGTSGSDLTERSRA
jgi:hypothetical protein